MAHFGIDLGTSNCLVGQVSQNLDDTFSIRCLSDDEGDESFPSVIYFENQNRYKVGNGALKFLFDKPDSTVELIKVRLGKTDRIPIKAAGEIFEKSPQELSAYLLSHFNAIHNNMIKHAVITVPAFFDQSQKNATMQAAIIADMEPKFLIEEPTAAIMYHIFSEYKEKGQDFFEGKQEKKILVFDFGGGTLDLSLIGLTLKDRTIIPKVITVGGDPELGGNIIDFIFTKTILTALKNRYSDDLFIGETYDVFLEYFTNYIQNRKLQFREHTSPEIKNFIFRLKRNLEQVKIKLTDKEDETIVIERQYQKIPINRKQFENYVLMSEELNIRERIENALDLISKKRERISEVLLIGGSSQIPFIKEIIIQAFSDMGITNDKVKLSSDFTQAVAKGAAIQSAIADGIPMPPFMLNKCESIVARDIEVEHAGKSKVFVPMGTEYPFEKRKEFKLEIGHALSDAVSLCLNESISRVGLANEKRKICSFDFYLPIYYRDDIITIYMDIDEAGLYQIEAVHNSTGETVEFESNKAYSLSESELKALRVQSKMMKEII